MANMRWKLRSLMGRRSRSLRLFVITGFLTVAYLLTLGTAAFSVLPAELDPYVGLDYNIISQRKLLTVNGTGIDTQGEYPRDIFSEYEREHGAVVLHVIGLIYMFVALAIVCDEFFVPSLGVIIERLNISEDVAGATFMAAGGSAPELFTSIIGVFFAKSNVGIGTIVGSAVFNILFVIGMCALFSREVLTLTWWPLFRDVTFYSLDLILLIVFFLDQKIKYWEALILFLLYFCYVTFMKFNHRIEKAVKGCLRRSSLNKVQSTDSLLNEKPERSCSLPILHAGAGRFRHGMLQLMIHTIDPIGNGDTTKHDDDAMHMHAIATLQVLKDSINGIQNGAFEKGDKENNTKIHVISNGQVSPDSNKSGETRKSPSASQETTVTMLESPEEMRENGKVTRRDVDVTMNNNKPDDGDLTSDSKSEDSPNFEEVEEPMDLSWPDTCRERFVYVLVAPIVFLLWITLPDVRRPEKRKWFIFGFLGSICWIACFSYLMVWWANITGQTMGIPDEVMGLTILAAGTSIPDLITSVIVAKKGFGDMAVSSSVGSNIFDITVGLPFPWLIYSAINNGAPKDVNSKGLLNSIILLFLMLVAVITSIAVSKWRMSRALGCIMFVLYVIFLTLSVLFELGVIKI